MNHTTTTTQIASPVVGTKCGTEETSSIYIVAVDERIKREFIFKKLCLLNIGYIHKLTEIPCKYQPGYKRVFIRIRWNTLPHTINIRNRLMIRETIKFVYELPWVWTLTSSSIDRRSITSTDDRGLCVTKGAA